MASKASVELIDPRSIKKNEENPRVIFRSDELQALEESIGSQGILVPLTVFPDKNQYTLLDGERRWRCALKLGLPKVPVIIQPKPDRISNIMMMFAIHNARRDWDPLPTARKLEELEGVLTERLSRAPKEAELAAAASLKRGEVRRYRKILQIPERLQKRLMKELQKARTDQEISVDQVLEAVVSSNQLVRSKHLDRGQADDLVDAVVDKFANGVIRNTVDPRKLIRIARQVDDTVSAKSFSSGIRKLINNTSYSIQDLYDDLIGQEENRKSAIRLFDKVIDRVNDLLTRGPLPPEVAERFEKLLKLVKSSR